MKNKQTTTQPGRLQSTIGLGLALILSVLTVLSWRSPAPVAHENRRAAVIEEPTLAMEEHYDATVRRLPDGLNNYVAASLTEADIARLAKKGVTTIVRLNGPSGKDAGELDLVREAAVASRHGMLISYYNIERDGESKAEIIANYLMRGNVVVHCKHGAHRAPAIAVYYLRTRTNLEKERILASVGWDPLPSLRYRKYVDLALGI